VCGIIFSGIVLRGVDWLFDHEINIMGWYAKGIIPAGALIVAWQAAWVMLWPHAG